MKTQNESWMSTAHNHLNLLLGLSAMTRCLHI